VQISLTELGEVSRGGADHAFINLRGFGREVIARLSNTMAATSMVEISRKNQRGLVKTNFRDSERSRGSNNALLIEGSSCIRQPYMSTH